jgi:PAS domain S-box-containing protein
VRRDMRIQDSTRLYRPLALVATAKRTSPKTPDTSDEFLRTIIDACASNVAVLDESGAFLYASQSWKAFWKANSSSVNFRDASFFSEWKRFDDRTSDGKARATLSDDICRLKEGTANEIQGRFCYHGRTEPVHFAANAARLDLPESGFRILITFEDILPSREALRTNDKRLSHLLEKTKIVVWEAEGHRLRFTYISKEAAAMFGYPLAQWYEPEFLASHIHSDDRERVLSTLRKQSQTVEQFDFVFRVIARDGKVVWVHNLVNTKFEGGRSKSLHGFMIDVTERKCAEEALRDLGGRLITAQEEERSRVARELHDDLNQRMALLSIELERLRQNLHNQGDLQSRLQALQTQTQEISADLHRLSYKLHPSKLDDLGLVPALKGLCQELSNQQLKIEIHQKGFPSTLPHDLTLCIFRIVQEALSNCVRHSGAKAVEVLLEQSASAVGVSISDNGCGFDLGSPFLKKGLGLISMRERVRLVRGEINVFSRPQRGTRIEVSVPLQRLVRKHQAKESEEL